MKPWFEHKFGQVTVYPGVAGLPTFSFYTHNPNVIRVRINKLRKITSLEALDKVLDIVSSGWFQVIYQLDASANIESALYWLREGEFYVNGVAYKFTEKK